jgi:D-serine deaminase-like pyridoxal phosphate-dependent protein
MTALDVEIAQAALAELRQEQIPSDAKGFGHLTGSKVGSIVDRQLLVTELELPVAIIDADSLDRDIRVLADFATSVGVHLAPHIKTSMSPQVFIPQLKAGAWAATVATIQQARVASRFGVRRIIVANELGSAHDVRALADLAGRYAQMDILCFADSVASVDVLLSGWPSSLPPLGVLIEVGAYGGRAGCRTVAAAKEAAHAVRASANLELRGVSAFEGVLSGTRDEVGCERVTALMRLLVEVGHHIDELRRRDGNGQATVLTAGGSVFFDVVARELQDDSRYPYSRRVVLRSGAYVVHDRGYLSEVSPQPESFIAALTVAGYVLSTPEPGLAIVGVGKRDIGSDLAMPAVSQIAGKPVSRSDIRIDALNDQHGYLRWDPMLEAPVDVGSVVTLTAAHPCTTFDRWQFIAIANAHSRVIDVARTFF